MLVSRLGQEHTGTSGAARIAHARHTASASFSIDAGASVNEAVRAQLLDHYKL